MKVERRGNQVHLHGYVCAAGRESRVLHHPAHGDFVETVEPGTFAKALEAAEDVKLTLNHGRELGSTRSNLALAEDAIGLKADAWTDDAEVMRAAERGELRGWSFTFRSRPGGDVWEDGKDGQPAKRSLRDIALDEVAVLTITPAYIATTVDAETRSVDGAAQVCTEVRSLEDPAEKTEDTETRAQDRARLELMKLEV